MDFLGLMVSRLQFSQEVMFGRLLAIDDARSDEFLAVKIKTVSSANWRNLQTEQLRFISLM